jgi:hypothetical protein
MTAECAFGFVNLCMDKRSNCSAFFTVSNGLLIMTDYQKTRECNRVKDL